jgi:glycosyltransferase involved in cell wall biosynthesis
MAVLREARRPHLPEKTEPQVKVYYVSDGHRQTSFLWRAVWPGEALADRGHTVGWRKIEGRPDVLVFVRPIASDSGAIVRAWRQRGATVICDFDDLFEHGAVPEGHGVDGYNWYGMESYGWPEAAHAACMECSAISCATEPLAQRLQERYPHLLVQVLPNYYNDRDPQWKREPRIPLHRRGGLTLGMLGSPTHHRDLEWIAPALEAVQERCPETRIVVSPGNEEFLVGRKLKSKVLTSVQYEYYRTLLDQLDVVLAPLEPMPLNQGKSAIRLMEAGLAGLPYVCSDTDPYFQYHEAAYRETGAHTGWLCSDQQSPEEFRIEQWVMNLTEALQKPELLQQGGRENRRFALTQGIRAHITAWENFYEEACRVEADRWK